MGVDYKHFLLPVRRDFVPSADRLAALVERLRRDKWVMTEEHFEVLYRDEDEDEDQEDPGDDTQLVARDPAWLTELVEAHEASNKPRYNVSEPILQFHRGVVVTSRMMRSSGGARPSRPVDEPLPSPLTAAWLEERGTDPEPLVHRIQFCVDPDRPFDDVGLRYPFTFGSGEDDNGQLSSHNLEIDIADDYIVPYPLSPRELPPCACGAPRQYEPSLWISGMSCCYHRTCPNCRVPFDVTALETVLHNAWNEERHEQRIRACAYRFALCINCEKAWPHEANHSGSGCEPIALARELLQLMEEETGERFEDFGVLS